MKNTKSDSDLVKGGGPQGGNLGILEYISQTRGNFDFLDQNEDFKFVDDASFLEILNLLAIGLSSINAKFQMPSDVPPEMAFLPPKNFKTQSILDKMSDWTDQKQMHLNSE